MSDKSRISKLTNFLCLHHLDLEIQNLFLKIFLRLAQWLSWLELLFSLLLLWKSNKKYSMFFGNLFKKSKSSVGNASLP